MVKRVGILTLPLHSNYGGIIQIAALYNFLADNGKEPLFLRKKHLRSALRRFVTSLVSKLPRKHSAHVHAKNWALHDPFIQRFMSNATHPLRTTSDFQRSVRQNALEAVIVGSDQVWRIDYHGDASALTYFLNFVDPASVRRISYAASFGHSSWNYPEYTEQATKLLSQFHAVGVREESGAEICRDTFKRSDARVVLDPTLLVDPGFYDRAVATGKAFDRPTVVKYVLDQSDKVQSVTAAALDVLSSERMTICSISPDDQTKPVDIPNWLQAFRDSEFVITDSFHGTIFAILFKRRFVTVPNHDRGFDRFVTLLKSLGLDDRLLTSDDPSEVARILAKPIDYDEVEVRLERLRANSRAFLLSALA